MNKTTTPKPGSLHELATYVTSGRDHVANCPTARLGRAGCDQCDASRRTFMRAGLDEDGRYPVSPDYYDGLNYADRPYASMSTR